MIQNLYESDTIQLNDKDIKNILEALNLVTLGVLEQSSDDQSHQTSI